MTSPAVFLKQCRATPVVNDIVSRKNDQEKKSPYDFQILGQLFDLETILLMTYLLQKCFYLYYF